jgi:hypothetical protein
MELYWEKPLLVTVTGKDVNGNVKYIRRYLEGYKLEINGKTYSCLGPNAQSCASQSISILITFFLLSSVNVTNYIYIDL